MQLPRATGRRLRHFRTDPPRSRKVRNRLRCGRRCAKLIRMASKTVAVNAMPAPKRRRLVLVSHELDMASKPVAAYASRSSATEVANEGEHEAHTSAIIGTTSLPASEVPAGYATPALPAKRKRASGFFPLPSPELVQAADRSLYL